MISVGAVQNVNSVPAYIRSEKLIRGGKPALITEAKVILRPIISLESGKNSFHEDTSVFVPQSMLFSCALPRGTLLVLNCCVRLCKDHFSLVLLLRSLIFKCHGPGSQLK